MNSGSTSVCASGRVSRLACAALAPSPPHASATACAAASRVAARVTTGWAPRTSGTPSGPVMPVGRSSPSLATGSFADASRTASRAAAAVFDVGESLSASTVASEARSCARNAPVTSTAGCHRSREVPRTSTSPPTAVTSSPCAGGGPSPSVASFSSHCHPVSSDALGLGHGTPNAALGNHTYLRWVTHTRSRVHHDVSHLGG